MIFPFPTSEQRIHLWYEALLEADKRSRTLSGVVRYDVPIEINDALKIGNIAPQLVRDLLRVIAVQAEALIRAREYRDGIERHYPSVVDSTHKALTESAPLVELAKRMEVV